MMEVSLNGALVLSVKCRKSDKLILRRGIWLGLETPPTERSVAHRQLWLYDTD